MLFCKLVNPAFWVSVKVDFCDADNAPKEPDDMAFTWSALSTPMCASVIDVIWEVVKPLTCAVVKADICEVVKVATSAASIDETCFAVMDASCAVVTLANCKADKADT